jgi:hypothetical protein
MTADSAVNEKIAAEAPLNLRFGPDHEPADDGGDAANQVADHVTGAHPLGKVKQPDAATDLDHSDEDVEAHPLLGRVLYEALSDLLVHRWLAGDHVQTVS